MNKMTVRNLVERGWTDRQIAEFYNIGRTAVVHFRKKYGIKRKLSTGRLGELIAIKKLQEVGYKVEDMNLKNKTASYDLLVNDDIRVEVKSASLSDERNTYQFILTNPPISNCIESNIRTVLNNGRSLKHYEKTCDIMMFVGITENLIWILPSKVMESRIGTVTLHTRRTRYAGYLNNFEEIEKALELSANLKQDFNKY
ncbi:hypothetical protein MUA27_10630 [Mammaliicoccus sciuri]|uniref:hypothetical protein n=1 Tax=Mammaliicoccus sciuri TaxID=1296 RepID=UPI0021D29C67|nr:hypothetical protein [Mammaliicoccus sciuri]UXU77322.1 hypothetical protein MUA27_10630 [Mammaliicoccus sciuri]